MILHPGASWRVASRHGIGPVKPTGPFSCASSPLCYNALMPDQPSPRRHFQFRLRTLFVAVTLFCVSAAAFTAYYPVRYESSGPGLYLLAFGLLGASVGTLFGRPRLGIVLGLVASFVAFCIDSDLLVNPHALSL